MKEDAEGAEAGIGEGGGRREKRPGGGRSGSWWQKIRAEAERNCGIKGFALYNRETVWLGMNERGV